MSHVARAALLVVASLAICAAASVEAGDHFRKAGIGYGAGYHAPAPCEAPTCCAKFHGYAHWKKACLHPGTPADCGGAPCAVPAAPCRRLPSIGGLSLPGLPLLGGGSCNCGPVCPPSAVLN